MELKPPLTIDMQIKKFVDEHNLIIDNYLEAKDILSRVNYYKLIGYGIGLKDPSNKELFVNTSLKKLYDLYVFDSKLRNIFSNILEYIEVEFKTIVSLLLSNKYGSECYMDVSNFNDFCKSDGTSIHESIVDDFNKEVQRHSNYSFVRHHNRNYDGHFPFWVAIELFTFGNIISIFNIMKDDDKIEICKWYGIELEHFKGWLLNFLEIRNICAHNNRLYNVKLKQVPYVFGNRHNRLGIDMQKIFPTIINIKRLFNSNHVWEVFYSKMIELVDEYKDIISYDHLGITENWTEILNRS